VAEERTVLLEVRGLTAGFGAGPVLFGVDLDVYAGELLALIKSGKRVCLLCYERDPNECHRSRIAALVKKRTRVKIENLIPPIF